ncbi:DUF7289 family protein [Halosimplex pelagicum]|uniref:Uncharacterized protein n=1 Tax=Halosimplex pelagicum TaxID=869886 RepID=A0A7D5T5Z6_9EURY|nr:hypothetical protein [Halosimplex pelagicum]QLH82788.1 hypothetical protein HZS54_14660 [Halosimplex pelagicum]
MNGPVVGERGVSDIVGFVMVFGMIASVVAIVSVAGLAGLESARDAQQTDNAVRAMEVLSDNMGDIAERGAPSRATEISLEDASLSLGAETVVTVRDPNESASDPSFLENRTHKIRPIVYDDGDTELVYAMGAIFRDDPQGGTVVQSWSPVFDDRRTMIPVVTTVSATDTGQQIQSSTVLVRARANDRLVPVADDEGTYDDVWINVTSPRSDLWLEMLGRDSALTCSRSGADTVSCHLDEPPERLYVTEVRIAVELKP